MRESYDAVVIGSGFGGAIVACRLAQAGRSVCVLERGRRWGKNEFPRTTGQVAHAFWNHDDLGLLDYRTFGKMDVLQASGLGGGSLVYFNVHLRAPSETFRQPAWPAEITRDALDPFYDVARDTLQARPLTPPDGAALPPRTRAFMAAARAAGATPRLVDLCVHTGPERPNPFSGIVQGGCVNCGNCLLGCHVHAKNTLDLNYLALAERNGAELHPLHLVDVIEPVSGPGAIRYRVRFRRLEPHGGARSPAGAVIGSTVIVAAGSLGTTELLLRCRDVHRTLPRLGAMLGQHFSGNGDFLLAGSFDTAHAVDPGWGPSITAVADFSRDGHQVTVEDLGFPDPFLWFLEGSLPLPGRLQSLKSFVRLYLLRTLGLSKATRFGMATDKLFRGGITTRFLPFLGIGSDAADGALELVEGRLEIRWNHRRSRRMFEHMEEAMRALSAGAGGRYSGSPLWRWPMRKLLTAHPLGGCVMSDDPKNGVVRPTGESWGHPGLFVADGSIIPTALGVNPSATICALSERIVAKMIAQRAPRPATTA